MLSISGRYTRNLRSVAGLASKLDTGISKGFGYARKGLHAAAAAGSTLKRTFANADRASGGLLSAAQDYVPGANAVLSTAGRVSTLLTSADKALNRAEGAYRMKAGQAAAAGKRVAAGASVLSSAIDKDLVPAAKRAKMAGAMASRELQQTGAGIAQSAMQAAADVQSGLSGRG
jgi:hypothetical protein